MKTNEICSVFRVFPFPQFDDVYSMDTLPLRPNKLQVCNLDPPHRLGSHVSSRSIGEYFDSMGRAPRMSYEAI